MGLVHPAYGKAFHNALVGTHAGPGIRLVEGAFMLIYHDPLLPQSLVAVAVELFCKQSQEEKCLRF